MEALERVERSATVRFAEQMVREPGLAIQRSELVDRLGIEGVARQNALGELQRCVSWVALKAGRSDIAFEPEPTLHNGIAGGAVEERSSVRRSMFDDCCGNVWQDLEITYCR